MFFDAEWGLYYNRPDDPNINTNKIPHLKKTIFGPLVKNEIFKRLFINRFNVLLNSIFLGSNLNQVISEMEQNITTEMKWHKQRWPEHGLKEDLKNWHLALEDLRMFVNKRSEIVKEHLKALD